MIYDIIIGETLLRWDYNYVNSSYMNRVETDDITDSVSLLNLMITGLKEYSTRTPESIDSVLNTISEFNILKERISKDELSDDDINHQIRELMSALAINGVDMYVIRRPDLNDVTMEDDKVRAYMIDKQDGYFPAFNRVVNGISLVMDNPKDATIANVVMQFVSKMGFNDLVEDSIIKPFRDKFDKLAEVNMSYKLEVTSLVQFLGDYGYKFIVVS